MARIRVDIDRIRFGIARIRVYMVRIWVDIARFRVDIARIRVDMEILERVLTRLRIRPYWKLENLVPDPTKAQQI